MPKVDQPRDGRAPRSAVVVNPSKIDKIDELRQTVDRALSRAGWPAPQWFATTPEDPGHGQARKAVEAGADVVFVCGGDGTIMSAVAALVGTDVALAILPAGTGNLVAANLGLSVDLATGIEVAVEGGRRRVDVGACDGKFFVVMAGMGFDADMLAATSETAKARIGWPAYVLGAVRHLRDRPMGVSIRIDGGEPMRRRARSVLVANVGRLQGGVRLLADAQPDDGFLDIAILTPRSLGQWAALASALVRRSRRVPSMEVYRGTRVEVLSSRPQPRQLDGDVIDPGRRLYAEVVPQALWLCVPQPAGHPDLAADADAAARRGARLTEERDRSRQDAETGHR
jgi:diacylglycerol kinase family enzyme